MTATSKDDSPPIASAVKSRQVLPVLSRRDIEARISDGQTITVIDGHALRLDGWLRYHPGGDKAILHMVGRDATDETRGFHSADSLSQMNRYRIGRIQGRWKNFLPPIQGGAFRPADSTDESADEVEDAGGLGQLSVSSSSSRAPSPIFDSGDKGAISTTSRGGAMHSTSASSASSVVDEDFDGMSHLDVVTRQKVRLDLDKYPSLDESVQDDIVARYRLLDQRLVSEGLYQTPYASYLSDAGRYLFLVVLMLTFLYRGNYALSAVFMGMAWHQLVFVAHDAGHNGITHNFQLDSIIGIVIADFLGGLSIGWWKRNHNVHHIVTNSPEHDPDIQHMPHFAVSHRFLQSLRSSYYGHVMKLDAVAKALVSLQSYLYYPTLAMGRFNLYRLSWDHLLMRRCPRKGVAWWHWHLEIAGNVFFWVWFGYGILHRTIPTAWDRFVFVMISHMVTCPLHVQITLSHFAMSTADLGPHESFPQKMLRTTMDVDCPPWLDFFHGGLQFQVVHHLFPRVPRYNLRRVQKYVQEFCNEAGIPYALYGFVDGNKQVIGQLAEVSRQAAILAKCQREIAKNGGIHYHHHHHHQHHE